MKEKVLYECELCHTQYAAMIDATSCEVNHKRVKSVDKELFLEEKLDLCGYPVEVILLMDDGQKIKYYRNRH